MRPCYSVYVPLLAVPSFNTGSNVKYGVELKGPWFVVWYELWVSRPGRWENGITSASYNSWVTRSTKLVLTRIELDTTNGSMKQLAIKWWWCENGYWWWLVDMRCYHDVAACHLSHLHQTFWRQYICRRCRRDGHLFHTDVCMWQDPVQIPGSAWAYWLSILILDPFAPGTAFVLSEYNLISNCDRRNTRKSV